MLFLNSGHIEFQEKIRKIISEQIAPFAKKIDEEGCYPREALQTAVKEGWTAFNIPKEYGGNKKDNLTGCILIEEVSRACLSSSCVITMAFLGSAPFLIAGNENQKMRYLPLIAKGEKASSFALTEPHAGSDAGAISSTAVRKDGGYIINGHKCFIGNAGESDIYVVFAKTDLNQKTRGISAFIVEKGTPGFKIGSIAKKMGINGQRTGELFFENCWVPEENLLGEEGRAFRIAMQTLDQSRIFIAAQGLGLAQAALDAAARHAVDRIQFGTPIAEHQGVMFKISEMATNIHAGRLMTYDAAALLDAGMPVTKEAAMAKYYTSETANKVAYQAVQIFGGRGFLKGFPVERYYRDARVLTLYEGTSEIQNLVIGRIITNEIKKEMKK